jgi:hypothetical protein
MDEVFLLLFIHKKKTLPAPCLVHPPSQAAQRLKCHAIGRTSAPLSGREAVLL